MWLFKPRDALGLVLVAWAAMVAAAPGPASDWTQPAYFAITDQVVARDPGPFSASSAYKFNDLRSGAFEPLVVRRKYRTTCNSTDTICVSHKELSDYDSFVSGWLDNSTVRVYRVQNGTFGKVRDDVIKAYRASGYNSVDNLMLPSNSSQLSYRFANPSWFRPNATLFLSVRAVDLNGNQSTAAPPVKLINAPLPPGPSPQPQQLNPTAVPAPGQPKTGNSTVPPAPGGVKAVADPATGIITVTWTYNKASWPTLAGFVVVTSDSDPAAFHGFGIDLVGGAGKEPLLAGDIVFTYRKDYTWSRVGSISDRVWNTPTGNNPPMLGASLCSSPNHCDTIYNGETQGAYWALVPHPQPVPAALQAEAGETCARFTVTANAAMLRLGSGGTDAGLDQEYYPVLIPGRNYTVSIWLRASAPVTVTIGIEGTLKVSQNFSIGDAWTLAEMPVAVDTYEKGGAVDTLFVSCAAPVTLHADNWRFYDTSGPYLGLIPEDRAALRASGLAFLRTHFFIKSSYGYSMESLTNPRGVTEYQYSSRPKTPHTLDSVLSLMREGGVEPWLQIEQYFSETELLGLVEFLVAPYDPAKGDSPQSKPWAFKRYSQNQSDPWTSVFRNFVYEISNENWNGMFCPWCWAYGWDGIDAVTGAAYSNAQMYGLWQEYTISVLKSSPYWTPAVDAQFKFSLGGWESSDDKWTGFGPQAGITSPNSSFVTVAGYNGGWDEGEAAAQANDEGFFKALSFVAQDASVHADREWATLQNLSKTLHVHYALGTYEAGPGYVLNGLNGAKINASQTEAENEVMKSLAGGTATLDSFLYRAYMGFKIQNFFTLGRNRYFWVSHAPLQSGGQAYPAWTTLSLFNVNGTGDFVATQPYSTPVCSLPGDKWRAAVSTAPVMSVYATTHKCSSQGKPYLCARVFVLSRKLDGYPIAGDDGYTPTTLQLPFSLPSGGAAPSTITLYSLTGNPRANNMDKDLVPLHIANVSLSAFAPQFKLNDKSGVDAKGVSPGATLMFAFDFFDPAPAASDCKVTVAAVRTEAAAPFNASFWVHFSAPAQGLNATGLQVSGTAFSGGFRPTPDGISAVVPDVEGGYMSFLVNITNMDSSGTVILNVAAGAATCTLADRTKIPSGASTPGLPGADTVQYAQ